MHFLPQHQKTAWHLQAKNTLTTTHPGLERPSELWKNRLTLIIISSLWYFITASKTNQDRVDFIQRNAGGAWEMAQQVRAPTAKSQFQPCEPYLMQGDSRCHGLFSDSRGWTQYIQDQNGKKVNVYLYTKMTVIFPIKAWFVEESQGLLQVYCLLLFL